MKRRHFIGLLGAGSLTAGAIHGSGAFSSIVAERQASVAVVGDEDAYLTLLYPERRDVGATGSVEVTIQNRTGSVLDLLEVTFDSSDLLGDITDISVDSSGFSADDSAEELTLGSSERFGVGSAVTITLTFDDFTDSGYRDLFFTVVAESESGDLFIRTDDPGRVIEIQGVPNTVPAGCPITPSVTVDVADGAQGTIDEGENGVTVSDDVDGNVIGGDVNISGATISGKVNASGDISTLEKSTIGGPVSSESGGDIGGTATDVRIDGDLVAGNDLDITDSVVAGKLKAGGNIGTLQSTDVGGSVVTGDGGDIGGTVNDVNVGGNIRCGGGLDITNSTVCGILNVGGDIGTFTNTSVGGSVIAGGGEVFSDVASIDPDDDLTDSDIGGTASGVDVSGSLLAGNDVDITDAFIADSIDAAGNVGIISGDPVEVGEVVTTGSSSTLTINDGARLDGDIDTDGNVVVDGTVDGDVSARGNVEGDGTITGTDPRE